MADERPTLMHPGNGKTAPETRLRAKTLAGVKRLPVSREQLDAVMRKNEELLKFRSLLTEKVAALEAALEKAHRYAYYDELTRLPNRRMLLDRFSQARSLATRHRQFLAVMFFDLNDFKSVNDRLGHEAGDQLLQQVAQRLSSVVRKSDTTCRYGGDEFVVLLTEMASRARALEKLHEIRSHLAPPYMVGNHSIRLTASVGIAMYPTDAEDLSELLRLSDRSMFSNKAETRDQSDSQDGLEIRLQDPGA